MKYVMNRCENNDSNFIGLFNSFEDELKDVFSTFSHDKFRRINQGYEIVEKENYYYLGLEAPGLAKDDVIIEIKDGILKIVGGKNDKNENILSIKKFTKTFKIPENVDEDKIEASQENGMIELILPKKEAQKPKEIVIKTQKSDLVKKLLKN